MLSEGTPNRAGSMPLVACTVSATIHQALRIPAARPSLATV